MSDPVEPPKTPAHELRSRQLSEPDWAAALDALPVFFREIFPGSIITAQYGFGCGIHADLTYVPMRIGVGWFNRFLRESVEQRLFVPGHSDLHIHSPDRALSITLCHEGDMHVSGSDSDLLRKFLSTVPYTQFQFPDT
jgi:hypothetical protein